MDGSSAGPELPLPSAMVGYVFRLQTGDKQLSPTTTTALATRERGAQVQPASQPREHIYERLSASGGRDEPLPRGTFRCIALGWRRRRSTSSIRAPTKSNDALTLFAARRARVHRDRRNLDRHRRRELRQDGDGAWRVGLARSLVHRLGCLVLCLHSRRGLWLWRCLARASSLSLSLSLSALSRADTASPVVTAPRQAVRHLHHSVRSLSSTMQLLAS